MKLFCIEMVPVMVTDVQVRIQTYTQYLCWVDRMCSANIDLKSSIRKKKNHKCHQLIKNSYMTPKKTVVVFYPLKISACLYQELKYKHFIIVIPLLYLALGFRLFPFYLGANQPVIRNQLKKTPSNQQCRYSPYCRQPWLTIQYSGATRFQTSHPTTLSSSRWITTVSSIQQTGLVKIVNSFQ